MNRKQVRTNSPPKTQKIMGLYLFFFALIGAMLGALALAPMARYFGKIPTAGFWNSFLVCLSSGLLVLAVLYLLSDNMMRAGFGTMIVFFLVLLAVAYTIMGSIIWKSSLMTSFRANIVWVGVAALLMSYGMSFIPH
jgi:hypothetical protein